MGKRLLAVVVLGALCLGAFAWGAREAPAPSNQDMVRISLRTPLSGSRTIPLYVAAGDRFRITLPSNVTTGYSWRLAGEPDAEVVKSTGSEYHAPSGARVGQGGTETWSFEARHKGKTAFALEYVRPWEKDVPAEKRQAFEVTVE
jgi:predicted secreted protein